MKVKEGRADNGDRSAPSAYGYSRMVKIKL